MSFLGPASQSSQQLPDPLSCFENGTVKLSSKETKWTSLEVRTHPTFLETLFSKYDFGPVKLPGLSRNRPLEVVLGTGKYNAGGNPAVA